MSVDGYMMVLQWFVDGLKKNDERRVCENDDG